MISPRDFSGLRGALVGISDRMLADHLAIYRGHVEALNAIDAEYPRVSWAHQESAVWSPEDEAILDRPISSLELRTSGPLLSIFQGLRQELRAAGLTWLPRVYFGDDGFWTADRATSINVPWFLATPQLWRLVNNRRAKYTTEEVERAMRHEVGHAVGYAFRLYDLPEWRSLFGSMDQPYRDEYLSDPTSREHVRYLHRTGDKHYAQKHPDEDWAETFATWLDPASDWRRAYAGTPALRKLEFVEALSSSGALSGQPVVTDPGQTIPHTRIHQTVRRFLGEDGPSASWSPHAELLRREPYAWDAVVLHELYFEALGGRRAASPGVSFPGVLTGQEAALAFGSADSWLTDLRAAAGSTGGWALTVWDHRRGRICNVLVEDHRTGILAGCPVLLAIDCWEHAYASDYGLRKDAYLGAVFRNLDWGLVESRLLVARGLAMDPPAPVPGDEVVLYAEPPPIGGQKRAGVGGRLVPVERTVMRRDGTAHKQTYWVRPEDLPRLTSGKRVAAKVHEEAGSAAAEEARAAIHELAPKRLSGEMEHLRSLMEKDPVAGEAEIRDVFRGGADDVLKRLRETAESPTAREYREKVLDNPDVMKWDEKRGSTAEEPSAGFPAGHPLADPTLRRKIVDEATQALSYSNVVGLGGAIRFKARMDAGVEVAKNHADLVKHFEAKMPPGTSLGDINRAIYQETQGLLKKNGIKEVVVYRGTNNPAIEEGLKKGGAKVLDVAVDAKGYSSFTFDPAVARTFGAALVTVRVPAERVLALPSNFPTRLAGVPGFLGGARNESEVVIAAGDEPLLGIVEKSK